MNNATDLHYGPITLLARLDKPKAWALPGGGTAYTERDALRIAKKLARRCGHGK